MKKSGKIILGIAAIAAVILVMLGVYTAFGPKEQEGTKAYAVTVTSSDNSEETYTGTTDAGTLRELMDQLAEDGFSYEGDDSSYGLYITTINGVTADYDADGAYWSIYVNGAYGQYGADTQPVADGDEFQFVYETYAAE